MGFHFRSSARYNEFISTSNNIFNNTLNQENYIIINKGNPNPSKFKIIRSEQIGNNLLLEINYPDCQNYEGNKILLYENMTIEKLLLQELIDPHFSDNKKYASPLARFEPTDHGRQLAREFLKNLAT